MLLLANLNDCHFLSKKPQHYHSKIKHVHFSAESASQYSTRKLKSPAKSCLSPSSLSNKLLPLYCWLEPQSKLPQRTSQYYPSKPQLENDVRRRLLLLPRQSQSGHWRIQSLYTSSIRVDKSRGYRHPSYTKVDRAILHVGGG